MKFRFLSLCVLILTLTSVCPGWSYNQKPLLGSQIDGSKTNNLVGCWLMNTGSSNMIHDLVHDADATFAGNVAWTAGGYGTAIDFDGDADYVENTSLTYEISSEISIVVWVKFDSFPDEQVLVRYKDCGVYIEQPVIGVTFAPDLDGGQSLVVNYTFVANTWYQIAITYNSSGYAVAYVNGVEIGNQAGCVALDLDSVYGILFGNLNAAGGTWDLDGQISHCYIYNYALTAPEVSQLYISPFYFIHDCMVSIWGATLGGTNIPIFMYHYQHH